MTFQLGDVLNINDKEYRIIGKITYCNSVDGAMWDEYRMLSVQGNNEVWLSIDDVYHEYSISFVVHSINPVGYHQVDTGTEKVMSASGNVDVDPGETALFKEYEDASEDNIISEEIWSDGSEYSQGYYIQPDQVLFERSEPFKRTKSGNSGCAVVILLIFIIVICLATLLPILLPWIGDTFFSKSITAYLEEDSKYTYSTSITGKEQQKADVYKAQSGQTVDTVSKDILKGISGKTDSVQEDTENEGESVAILTDNEYCLVYLEDETNDVLVQISDRKYAYTSDNDVYHGTVHSRRYYRRFYYSRGYSSDSSRYSGYTSPYSSYSDSTISYNSSNTYNSYSSSIRQSSIFSRSSSGGGLSSGK